MDARALVVTTINAPNPVLRTLAADAYRHGVPFVVAGDVKTPADFYLEHANYLDVAAQVAAFPELCEVLPLRHYTRKNVGYLVAVAQGATEIQETDDDNKPMDTFWMPLPQEIDAEEIKAPRGWFNVYRLFTDEFVWPRGFPLQRINDPFAPQPAASRRRVRGLIVHGLADDNPDVDAVFRLTRRLPLRFERSRTVVLPPDVWCPFNSQNTIFRRAAFPLLYLPSRCSLRMTDIWRSFVAQRCLWELSEGVVFHSPTVRQDRNEHDLLRDFRDEIEGYLNYDRVRGALEDCVLDGGDMARSQVRCYEALIGRDLLPADELPILSQWCRALERLGIG
jgi:hypothetical protein